MANHGQRGGPMIPPMQVPNIQAMAAQERILNAQLEQQPTKAEQMRLAAANLVANIISTGHAPAGMVEDPFGYMHELATWLMYGQPLVEVGSAPNSDLDTSDKVEVKSPLLIQS